MVRSDNLSKGAARAPHRSLLKALGFVDEEMAKPIIGIANSFNEIIPGHMHLKNLVQAVKDGIREAGGIPMEFNTIGICDGLATVSYTHLTLPTKYNSCRSRWSPYH